MTLATAEAGILRDFAHPAFSEKDYEPLVELAATAQFVLIGEASHGTEEFYAMRAALTRRLIAEKGFRAIALEADWPDTLRVHRYVTGRSTEPDATEALGDFRRFPAWMWRNTVMVDFVTWLRDWNARTGGGRSTGIFGMDLYGMHASIKSVLNYLEKTDVEAADARGSVTRASSCLAKIRKATVTRPRMATPSHVKRKSLRNSPNCAASMASS